MKPATRTLLAKLRQSFAHELAPYPVHVRIADIPDALGEAWFDPKRKAFRIRLDRAHSECPLLLMHEFAHLLSLNPLGGDHGPSFGLAYARVCQVYEEFCS